MCLLHELDFLGFPYPRESVKVNCPDHTAAFLELRLHQRPELEVLLLSPNFLNPIHKSNWVGVAECKVEESFLTYVALITRLVFHPGDLSLTQLI